MSRPVRFLFALTVVALFSAAAVAVETPSPEGHWEGSVNLPALVLEVIVDLVPAEDGWTGRISIPQQGATDLPLASIRAVDDVVSFTIAGVPGEPSFRGRLDGGSLAGDFTQAGQVFPFSLSRELPPAQRAVNALDGIDEVIRQALADFGVPGLALGVIVGDEVVLAEGYGMRDVEAGLPVTSGTLFAIGSATKAFTTCVLAMLVDEGAVEWDRPVREYLPELRLQDDHATLHLTVRDLVTHRSGLPRHDLAWYNADVERSDLVARLAHLQPFADLRERFHYQNLMFLTAGFLIERVTGRSWEENVRERIFGPLGMTSSNLSVEDSKRAGDFAQPYHSGDGETKKIPFRNIDAVGPAGSINSTADDMLRWLGLHLGHGRVDGRQLVGEATLREMHSPQALVAGYPEPDDLTLLQSYGLGWFIEAYRGRFRIHHGGGIDGFISMVSFLPRERIGIVVLTNASGVGLSPLVTLEVTDRLLGEGGKDWLAEALDERKLAVEAGEEAEVKRETARVEGTSPSRPLVDYQGDYAHPGYGTAAVTLLDGGLRLTFNQMTHPLTHWHYDVFEIPEDDEPGLGGLRVQFRADMDGRVSALIAPLDREVDLIVFERQPDRRLRDPEVLRRFAGKYRLPNLVALVTLRGDRLELELPGQPLYRLEPKSGATFGIEGLAGFSLRFTEEEDGRVSTVDFIQPDGVYGAARFEDDAD